MEVDILQVQDTVQDLIKDLHGASTDKALAKEAFDDARNICATFFVTVSHT